MKTVILTRTGFHHAAFINRLQERFEISCVVREAYPMKKKEHPFQSALKGLIKAKDLKDDASYLRWFHETYSAGFRLNPILQKYLQSPFDVVMEKPGAKYIDVACGEVNSDAFVAFLRDLSPDIVAVLGSSVLKPPVIAVPGTAMINLHSGLSPYYRGTWSYGWPIVNNEPEYIGATVHHIDPGIDRGDMIFQTRPALEESDDLNDIFLKVIAEGIELVVDAIEAFTRQVSLPAYQQPSKSGRLYCSGDLNADAARLCLSNLGNGIVRRYNAGKESIDSKVVLYGYVPPKLFR